MSLEGITSSAKDVGKNVLERGTNLVKWGSHKVGDVGGFLRDKAAVVMSFIKGFFSNLPSYFSDAKTYARDLVQHIKENKAYSAGIAGIAAAITFGALFAIKHLTTNREAL